MRLETFYDDDRGEVHFGRILALLLGIVVAVGALSFAAWGVGVWTAPWFGRQNAHRIVNDPRNQIFQYEHFFTLDADVHADVANLRTEAAQAKAHRATAEQADPLGVNATEQARLDSVVTGTSAHCEALVAQYNNDAREYTKDTFLSHQLPAAEDPTLCEVPA